MNKFTVETQFPVAYESLDHLHPRGTIHDNSSNSLFIKKTIDLGIKSVLDLGCAGGGMVEEFLRYKIPAIGIEGSNISKDIKRAAWATIPDNLFTADATKPFYINYNNEPMIFDMVTCWEFFEHIETKDLPELMENIRHHTAMESLLLCSITSNACYWNGVDLHKTQQGIEFWLPLFEGYGFFRDGEIENHYDNNWVRIGSFNLALRRSD